MSKLRRWLSEGVRWGVSNAPQVARAARGAAVVASDVATETRDAFRRGLRGEPEPPPRVPGAPRRTPTPEQVTTWFANLEVEPASDLETVHRAWKRLQRKYHPDLHSDDAERAQRATELIQQLNAAYAGLKARLEK